MVTAVADDAIVGEGLGQRDVVRFGRVGVGGGASVVCFAVGDNGREGDGCNECESGTGRVVSIEQADMAPEQSLKLPPRPEERQCVDGGSRCSSPVVSLPGVR